MELPQAQRVGLCWGEVIERRGDRDAFEYEQVAGDAKVWDMYVKYLPLQARPVC